MENFKSYLPSYPVNQYIKSYWIIKGSKKANNFQKIILPYSEVCIKFLMSNNMNNNMNNINNFTTGIYVSPPMTNFYSISLNDDFYYVDLTFFPGVFSELFKIPISILENRIYKVDELSLGIDNSLLDILYENRNNENATIKILDNYFSNFIKKLNSNSLLMQIKELYTTHNLDKFYKENSSSMRQIQRKVKECTGLTPRTIQRISRFHKIIENFRYSSTNSNASVIAQNLEFFDQSHLIKDFKSFSGITPKLFLSNRENFLY
jgi:AraC-like DNA-binding protein